jgi:glucose/mannose-6-phosphate isomerase
MKYQSDALSKFPQQIDHVLQHYQAHGLKISRFRHMVICGLGGSGIGGRIAKVLCEPTSPVPIEVVSDYVLPGFTSGDTLVIASSYSGNTEETLSMYQEAQKVGAPVIAISTGGHLLEKAQADGFIRYETVPGFQPRMALGYSLTTLLLILEELGMGDFRASMEASRDRLSGNPESFIKQAQEMMDGFPRAKTDKYVVVVDRAAEPFGLRFCQQLNENSKHEAFLSELPEANHNQIETYYGQMPTNFVLLDGGSSERTSLRFQFLKGLLERQGNSVFHKQLDGSSLPDMLAFSYVLDWYSLLLADAKNLNSEAIPNIKELKEYLSKH